MFQSLLISPTVHPCVLLLRKTRAINNSHLNMLQELSRNSDYWKKNGLPNFLMAHSPTLTKKPVPFFFPLSRWIPVCDSCLIVDRDMVLDACFSNRLPQDHMRHLWKSVDLGAHSWTDEIWILGLGLGRAWECAVFPSSPGKLLVLFNSEHCFMGMKSLVIGINCWMWFRKKTCSSHGRGCGFLILFLLSLPDVTNWRHSLYPCVKVLGSLSSQKWAFAHRHLILLPFSGGWWVSWNPFMDIYGCSFYLRSPSPEGIILRGKEKWKHQVNTEETQRMCPEHPYSWIFCALNKDAHQGCGWDWKCSLHAAELYTLGWDFVSAGRRIFL